MIFTGSDTQIDVDPGKIRDGIKNEVVKWGVFDWQNVPGLEIERHCFLLHSFACLVVNPSLSETWTAFA